MSKSHLEDHAVKIMRFVPWLEGYKREYRFLKERRWRFDFAWPEKKIALEIQGGIWNHGGHVRGGQYTSDCEKFNEATILGWAVLKVTADMIKSGRFVSYLERMFNARE